MTMSPRSEPTGKMKLFWDTNLFIYLWEEGPFTAETQAFADWIISRDHKLITSSLTMGEILVQPHSRQNQARAKDYELAFDGLEIIPFDRRAASVFASLRAEKKSLRPPDAIQLACATIAEADAFITNDDRLSTIHTLGKLHTLSLENWTTLQR